MNRDVSPDEPPGVMPEVAVTRSEERLKVHLVRRPYARLVVRKVVVTDVQTITVEVRREELRVKRIPISDPTGEIDLADDVELARRSGLVEGHALDLVLYAEQPVVTMRIVPVERVRVDREIVTLEQQLDADLRVEHVEFDDETSL